MNKGGRGRRTPAHLKALTGNPGQRPINTPPELPPGVPAPPEDLPDGARALYEKLAGLLSNVGLLTEADGPALADLALCLHRLRECEAIVEREGLVVQGRDGPKAHPATRLAKDYRQAAQAWARAFGLTPHARGSLDVKPTGGVKDPLEELLEVR